MAAETDSRDPGPAPRESRRGGATAFQHSLSLRNVTKRYGSVTAADNVSMTVPTGEFLTLLGPSGSGKTTILMMIAGFVDPTAGDIFVDDRRITNLPPEKRNFGMVFQGYALFPHMTVYDNVAYPLKVRRVDRGEIDSKVRATLDFVRLGELADRLPQQLSGGQQQRVALARALSFSPDMLLLDEPLGALDKKLRTEVQLELKQLHQRVGTTFVYVTHDQEEALSMSDRVAVIRDGRIVQIDTPRELYERPATRFVADFLGKSNFIVGTVAGGTADGFAYEAGGHTFSQAVANGNARPDGKVVAVLRPEKINVSDAAAGTGVNCVEGEIRNWSYFGTTLHFTIRTRGIGDIVVDVPAWRNQVVSEVGRKVWLSWDPDATVIVADDEQDSRADGAEDAPR